MAGVGGGNENQIAPAIGKEPAVNVNRSLREYIMPTIGNNLTCLVPLAITAANYVIKLGTMQLVQQRVQFNGLPEEDPNENLRKYEEICGMFKMNGVPAEAIKMKLFSFSLSGKAKTWFYSLPVNSITTWANLTQKFMDKFVPPGRVLKIQREIASFSQNQGERIFETWEMYNDMLRRCPNNRILDWLIVQTFYNGLTDKNKRHVDSAAGGSLMDKTYKEVAGIFENMTANSYKWYSDRTISRAGIYEVDAFISLFAQLAALAKKVNGLAKPTVSMVQSSAICDICCANHATAICPVAPVNTPEDKPVMFVGNNQRN